MPLYAQIDGENTVIGVSRLRDQTDREDMIPIDELDPSLLGKRYNSNRREFEDQPVEEREPTDEELRLEELEAREDLSVEERVEAMHLRMRLRR